jgi:hemerythrin superfamily protein
MNGRSSGLDAIRVLKSDHRKVEACFKQFNQAVADAERLEIATQICAILRIHTKIEEEIFYPAFLQLTHDAGRHHEAVIEHSAFMNLVEGIERSDPTDEYFCARVHVLAEQVKYHVKEEEKPDGMFAEARKAGMDLQWVGRTLQMRKQQLAEPRGSRAEKSRDQAQA